MDGSAPHLLFADRDLCWSLPLRRRLAERGLKVTTTSDARELLDRVSRFQPDLVVLGDGLDELGSRLLGGLIQERSPDTRIIRALPSLRDGSAEEPGPAESVLCTILQSDSSDDLVRVVTRILGGAPRASPPSRPRLVVCIDDDAEFLRSLSRVVRRQGYRVLAYTDPEIALEELPLARPDLVILDLLMPGLDGFEVLDELRQFHGGRIPVILLSAVEGDGKMEEGRRRGAACYLTKSCASQVLVEAMHRLLGSPPARRSVRRDADGGKRGRDVG